MRQLTRDQSGRYREVLANDSPVNESGYLIPGTYTLDNGDGGSDVGPFRMDSVVPAPVIWTNRKAFLQRDPPLTLYWSGGDPEGFVVMSSLFANVFAGGQLLCVAQNTAGRITIPGILWRGNATSQVGGEFGPQQYVVEIGSLSVPSRFSARGLDTGLAMSLVLMDAVYGD